MKIEEYEELKLEDRLDLIVSAAGDIRKDNRSIVDNYCKIHAMLSRLMPFLIADIILTTLVFALLLLQYL